MEIKHHYVRRKDDPMAVLMSGYSDFTGQFDPLKYEMVLGETPKGTRQETILSIEEKLKRVLKTAPVSDRAKFYQYKAALDSALDNNDREAAAFILQNLTGLSAELELLKTKMLEKFV